MAVATGIVGGTLMTAVAAALDVTTQRCRTTHGQITQSLALPVRQPRAVLGPKRVTVFPNDVRHFHCRSLDADSGGHGWPSIGAAGGITSRSSRLGMRRRCRVLIWT